MGKKNMINKAINHLVLATVDSLTKFKNKLAYYLAIFAMVFGSTFGSINSAYADAGQTITVGDGLDPAVATFDTTRGDDLDPTADTFTDSHLDVSGTATLTLLQDDSVDELEGIGDDDILNVTGAFTLTVADDTVNDGDALDTLTINATGTGTIIDFAEAITGTANDLIKITAASGSKIVLSGADTHVAKFDGAGTLQTTGVTTISNAVGADTQLGTLNIDNTATFSSTVNAAAVDVITAKVATFSGDVTSTTIVVNGTGNAKFVGAVTATDINLTGGGTVTLNNIAAKTITANITEATAGTTELVVADTVDGAHAIVTVSGDVTVDDITVGDTLKAGLVKFTGSTTGAAAVTGGNAAEEDSNMEISSNTHTGTVALEENGLGDAAFTLSGTTSEIVGAITTTGDGEGQVVAAGTTNSTFDAIGTDLLKVQTATVNANSVATFGSAVAADTLTVTGTATFQAKENESETIVFADGSSVILDDTLTNGQVVFSEVGGTDPAIDAGAKVYLPTNLSNGQTLIFFLEEEGADGETHGDAAGNDTELDATMQNTALMSYDAALSADADGNGRGGTIITATAKAEATTASELAVTKNYARSLKQALAAAISDVNADSGAEDAFGNAMNALGGFGATEDTALAKQVAPQDDMISGSTFATKAMTGSLQGIMSNRMASLRSGDAFMTGMSAGNGMSANSGFIQAFGTEAEQKNKTVGSGTQFGYDASSAGLALGFDGITDNGSVVGLSLSMSSTDVDGKGTGNSKNDIDSYTVSVYADKTTDAGYIEGSLTVGLNENNSSRIVNTAGLDRTYKGDYDSEQVSLKIGGGMPNAVGTGFVTPYGSVTATKISTDAYTETSTTANDNLRLRVAQADVDSIVGTVGLKYHTILDNGGTPMISLAVNNEFGDTTINSSNTYQGGGTAFNTSTDVEELSATLGLGYSFRSDNTTLELAYEADANDDDYLGHYGSIKIVSKF